MIFHNLEEAGTSRLTGGRRGEITITEGIKKIMAVTTRRLTLWVPLVAGVMASLEGLDAQFTRLGDITPASLSRLLLLLLHANALRIFVHRVIV